MAAAVTRRKTTKAKAAEPLTPVEPTDANPAPFDEAVGYDIGDKQVNLAQLAHEIEQATGVQSVNLALGDTVLWLTPAGLDAAVLAQVIADHVPDPDWGVPGVLRLFGEALARLREDPDAELTDADRDALVKGVALNFAALLPPVAG